MQVIKTLNPGMPGTDKWHPLYGDPLVSVRYRKDPVTGRTVTTVERVVEQHYSFGKDRRIKEGDKLIYIGYDEEALRCEVKAAGGVWVPERRLWRLSNEMTIEL